MIRHDEIIKNAEYHGMLPPQCLDLEEVVLGAILIVADAIYEVMEFLKPEMFYKQAHQEIYRAALDLQARREPIDILTVTNALRKAGKLDDVGGPFYIITLQKGVFSSANIVTHARIVHEKYIGRELIRISQETAAQAYSETTDIFELVDTVTGQVKNIVDGVTSPIIPINEIADDEAAQVKEAIKRRSEGTFVGVPTGLVDIDKITGGWQKSELTIIGARPGMGKSRLSVSSFAKYPAKHGIPVVFFSLEMSAVGLMRILACSECDIDPDDLKVGRVTPEEYERYEQALKLVSGLPIYIQSKGRVSVAEIEAITRRLQRENGVQLVIIDYLQKISPKGCSKGSNRTAEVDFIAASLKAISVELNIPVISIASMNRGVENRGGIKKPQLSDLRESGNIESDADNVIFLYRPSYYGITQDEQGNDISKQIEVIFEKNRNGKLSTEIIICNEYMTKFYDNNHYGYIPPNTSFYEQDHEF